MIKILIRGGLTGVAIAFWALVLLAVMGMLVKVVPWLIYVFLLAFFFGFVVLINWAFKD
jgi:hypothetical protein